MKTNPLFARRIFDEDDSISNKDSKAKQAKLEPAGSRAEDHLTIIALMKMGLTRSEARAYISSQRGYGV